MKRYNLKVPFDMKTYAKSHGAKWDAKNKTWYIVNMDKRQMLYLFPFFGDDIRSDIEASVPLSIIDYFEKLYAEEVDVLPASHNNFPIVPSVRNKTDTTKNKWGNSNPRTNKDPQSRHLDKLHGIPQCEDIDDYP